MQATLHVTKELTVTPVIDIQHPAFADIYSKGYSGPCAATTMGEKPSRRTERKKAMARHKREAKVYFAVDGEEGYYIGSTEWPEERRREHERDGKRIVEEFPSTHATRYLDEYELIEFAEGMGIPLTNTYRKHHGNFKGVRHKPDR